MSQQNPYILRAIGLLGSQAALAERIDRSQQAVSNMLAGQPVSGEVAVAIDQATLGQVSRHDLRPDLFPAPLEEGKGSGLPVEAGSPVLPGEGRVLRIARVEYAAGAARVFLSDGSELVGLTQCCVSRYSPDQPADVSLTARIHARKPKEAP